MAKIVEHAPDGTYVGLVERPDDDLDVRERVAQAAQRDAERLPPAAAGDPTPAEGETLSEAAASPENASESAETALARLSYGDLRHAAAEQGIDLGPHPKKDDLIEALAKASRRAGD